MGTGTPPAPSAHLEGNGQTILILVRDNTGGLPIQVKQVTFTPI